MGGRSKLVLRSLRDARWLRWLLPLALLAAAVMVLRTRLPSPGAVVRALDAASPVWLAVAVVAELVSLDMFARQQRRLLRAFGVRMSQPRALALTFSRSAITYAVPAGSAVSAAFAFSQFRSRGASRSAATTVTVLSGVASTLGLLAVYVAGAIGTTAPSLLGNPDPGTVCLAVAAAALAAAGLASVVRRRSPRRPAEASVPPDAGVASGFSRLRASVADALREARAVPRRHWYAAVALAALNWLTDLVCLVAVAHALHLSIGVLTLGSAYLAVQVIRQVPVTPGGVGLVETSLLAALVSAGAGQVPAAAVVLGYRLLSCWLIIPVGLLAWFGLRPATRPAADPIRPEPHRPHPSPRVVSGARRPSGSTCVRGWYGPRPGSRPRSCTGATRRRATRSV
jgi:putative heme transporter